MSLATRLSRLILFLGKISSAVVLSTNLILKFHSFSRLLIITVNKMTPSFVPRGLVPPLSDFQSDKVLRDPYSLSSISQECPNSDDPAAHVQDQH